MKKGWNNVEVELQEDMLPASKKWAQEFLDCSKRDAAVVHVITPWFSNAVAGLQLLPMQPGSTWHRHSCSWKILFAISMCHRIACLDARLSCQNCLWSGYHELPDGLLVLGGPMARVASAECIVWPCWDIYSSASVLKV